MVENFVETVEATLPPEATIVKTIGDEVMVVSPDAASLTEWAVGLLARFPERPQPRVGIHYANAVYRDGDYFGTHVNLAHRVVSRAQAGEVLVTDRVTEAIAGPRGLDLRADRRGQPQGLPAPTPLFVVARALPIDPLSGVRSLRRRWPRCRGRGLPIVDRLWIIDRVGSMDERGCWSGARGRALPAGTRGGDALRGSRLGLPARPRVRLLGPEAVTALHVNYGLRDDSDADEAHCARALRAARRAARDRAAAASRGPRQPAGLGARQRATPPRRGWRCRTAP